MFSKWRKSSDYPRHLFYIIVFIERCENLFKNEMVQMVRLWRRSQSHPWDIYTNHVISQYIIQLADQRCSRLHIQMVPIWTEKLLMYNLHIWCLSTQIVLHWKQYPEFSSAFQVNKKMIYIAVKHPRYVIFPFIKD